MYKNTRTKFKILDEKYDSKRWKEHTTKNIQKRDHYQCKLCGDSDKILQIHHIVPCKNIPFDLFFYENNLITLCKQCHDKIHEKYFKKYNTKEIYNKKVIDSLIKIFYSKENIKKPITLKEIILCIKGLDNKINDLRENVEKNKAPDKINTLDNKIGKLKLIIWILGIDFIVSKTILLINFFK